MEVGGGKTANMCFRLCGFSYSMHWQTIHASVYKTITNKPEFAQHLHASIFIPDGSLRDDSSLESLQDQEIPSQFKLDKTMPMGEQETPSVYSHESSDSMICVCESEVQLRSSGRHWSLPSMDCVPISVCMDGEYGYAISDDSCISKFDLGTGKTVHTWPVPTNAYFHQQMAVINGKIYYCNVNNNEIIIFPTSMESAPEQSIMSLGTLEKPTYIADNTKHKEETVIISGASGVGNSP